MVAKTVGDMTLEELNEAIDRRIKKASFPFKRQDKRTMKEVLESIERHRIVPAPGSKSARQMLREDRDR